MNLVHQRRGAVLALAVAGLAAAAVLASAGSAGSPGFFTSQPAMLTPTPTGSSVLPIISVGDTLGNGYRFEAIPDGIGLLPNGNGTVDAFVNHETSLVPFPLAANIANCTSSTCQSDFDTKRSVAPSPVASSARTPRGLTGITHEGYGKDLGASNGPRFSRRGTPAASTPGRTRQGSGAVPQRPEGGVDAPAVVVHDAVVAAASDSQTVRTSDGRTLMFAEWGDLGGFPVFTLHGTPGSRFSRHYDESVFVEVGARVITYDRPGYGGSDRDRGRRVVDCVADVSAIADMLGVERFAVLGGSGGGPHCLAVAARLPGRVTRASCAVGIAP